MSSQENGFYDNSISDTLYIPLYARAKESEHIQPIILDKKAAQIIADISLDEKVIDGGEISTLGILSRTQVIDESLNQLISDSQNVIIINLGVGLDTRISRMNRPNIVWYDIDFPSVIAERKKLFGEYSNITYLSESILDDSWYKLIDTSNSQHIIFIAEGLLMYFSEEQVKSLFETIARHFPNSHLYFDVVHSYFVGKGISSTFQWGLNKADDIKQYAYGISILESWSTGNLHKQRQSFLIRLLNVLPSTRNRSQILHIQFSK